MALAFTVEIWNPKAKNGIGHFYLLLTLAKFFVAPNYPIREHANPTRYAPRSLLLRFAKGMSKVMC